MSARPAGSRARQVGQVLPQRPGRGVGRGGWPLEEEGGRCAELQERAVHRESQSCPSGLFPTVVLALGAGKRSHRPQAQLNCVASRRVASLLPSASITLLGNVSYFHGVLKRLYIPRVFSDGVPREQYGKL